jgi:hypothetical protein
MRNISGRLQAALGMAAIMAATSPAAAQVVTLPSGNATGQAVGYGAVGDPFVPVDTNHPLPVGGKQEAFALVTANTSAAAVTAYGGDYVFAQSCSVYGTVSLRVRGPDGGTMTAILSKTAADSAGGTGVALGANAVVDAVTSGTTGCDATLTRVP